MKALKVVVITLVAILVGTVCSASDPTNGKEF